MVDRGDRVLEVLLIQEPGLEMRFGGVIAPFFDDLEKSAQRILIVPLLEELLPAAVLRIVGLRAEGQAVAAFAASRKEQEQQQPARQVDGAQQSPHGATGKGLNA